MKFKTFLEKFVILTKTIEIAVKHDKYYLVEQSFSAQEVKDIDFIEKLEPYFEYRITGIEALGKSKGLIFRLVEEEIK